ncbi:hypothetical protein HZZ13_00295 [Bradyrhizobium sp. CNPSo 4010]|uniref:Uncharacterized protein n=1 Tax=Bradyrhizobium agreste TaxID=2751811 RepID=A0ABS0PH51_9BRAD|nr:hypothetical protein [Bradyrhizobium agreste]MBH5396272.1 hypothetical protein [Bradyrhizobium agreste]
MPLVDVGSNGSATQAAGGLSRSCHCQASLAIVSDRDIVAYAATGIVPSTSGIERTIAKANSSSADNT